MVSVIIAAAGSAVRMGGIKKQLLEIDRCPILVRSVLAFCSEEDIDEIVVVVKKEDLEEYRKLLESYAMEKPCKVVAGGDTRQSSVLAGVLAVDPKATYLCIHDGARPFVDAREIRAVLFDGVRYGAATLGVKVKDTVKQADAAGFVVATPDRDTLYQIQTPQVFRKDLYLAAVKTAAKDYSDDCQLVEAVGHRVFITPGSYDNIKITTPEDMLLAYMIDDKRKGRPGYEDRTRI